MGALRGGRLTMVTVGLGVGAAIAAAPGIASADTTSDPLNWLGGLDPTVLPAAPVSDFGLNLDISVNGQTLLDLGSGATATSTTGNFAIAFGSGSTATAGTGTGNGAIAFGDNSSATTGGSYDYALASGGAHSTAGGFNSDTFDFSDASGSGSNAETFGTYSVATATAGGNAEAGDYADDSYNSATANGIGTGAYDYGGSYNSTSADDPFNTNPELQTTAISGDDGNYDSATAIGQNVTANSGLGDASNNDSAFSFGNLFTPTTSVTDASATIGNQDTAFVFDPLGVAGSTAESGGTLGYNSDLAGVFGDMLHALANTGSNLTEILPNLF